jgi:hypothetical protein
MITSFTAFTGAVIIFIVALVIGFLIGRYL